MSEFTAAAAAAEPDGFVAGFASRHVGAGLALQRAFSSPPGFAARAVSEWVPAARAEPEAETGEPIQPRSFSPQPPPKHFSPAEPGAKPTAGWDPLDPDPLRAARDAGYAEGMAAASRAVDAAGERDRALLAGLLDQLSTGRAIDREALARRLRETVLLLVGKVVGEVGVSADLLAGRIEAAVDHLSDTAEPALLRVHPDDVALLDGRLPPSIFAAGDAHVARGSFVLESASTVVDDGPALWLQQLEAAVERVAVPR